MLFEQRIKPFFLLPAALIGIFLPERTFCEPPIRVTPGSLIQQRDYARALNLITEGDGIDQEGDLPFQRAYCLQQLERWQDAASIYRQLLEEDSPLEDYLRLFAATCFLQSGEFAQAEHQLELLLEEETDSLLQPEARELLGELYLQWDRPQEAAEIFRHLIQESRSAAEESRFLWGLARAQEKAHRPAEAGGILWSIITGHPPAREALPALQRYLALRPGVLSGAELFQAGHVYDHDGRYDQAVETWDRFAEGQPYDPHVPEALYLGAQACYRAKHFAQARERCDRLLTLYPQSERTTSARYLQVRCIEAQGDLDEAIGQYRRFVDQYDWSRLADEALRRLSRIYEQRGDLAAAEREYWNISQHYASRQNADLALWRAGLYAFLRGDDDMVLSRMSQLLRRDPSGPFSLGAYYWMARAQLRAGRADLAARNLAAIIERDEDSYYSFRARERLGATRSAVSRPFGEDDIHTLLAAGQEEALPADVTRSLQKGQLLLRLGLLPQARRELSGVHAVAYRYPQLLANLLRLYERQQLFGDALRLAQVVGARWSGSDAGEALEIYLYPLSHMETVRYEAQSYGLDPYLILALMRVESLFDPLAVSPAGAQGLMQVMPATAGDIARELEEMDRSASSPFDPQWSICMGAYYLWRQYRAFDGQVEFALAAYNAGPGNAGRWLRRLQAAEPELFVELIDFSETSQFIKKVLTARAHYRRIWDHGP